MLVCTLQDFGSSEDELAGLQDSFMSSGSQSYARRATGDFAALRLAALDAAGEKLAQAEHCTFKSSPGTQGMRRPQMLLFAQGCSPCIQPIFSALHLSCAAAMTRALVRQHPTDPLSTCMCAGDQAGQRYKRLLSLPQLAGTHAGSTGAMWPFAGSHRPGLPDDLHTAGPEAETDLAALLLIRPPSSLAATSELARPASALDQQDRQAARGTTPDQQNAPPLMWTVQVKAAQAVAAGCNLAGLLTATSLSATTDATGQWVQQLPAIDERDRWARLL